MDAHSHHVLLTWKRGPWGSQEGAGQGWLSKGPATLGLPWKGVSRGVPRCSSLGPTWRRCAATQRAWPHPALALSVPSNTQATRGQVGRSLRAATGHAHQRFTHMSSAECTSSPFRMESMPLGTSPAWPASKRTAPPAPSEHPPPNES